MEVNSMNTSKSDAVKKHNIARLTSAALFSITGKAKNLIEQDSDKNGLSSWVDKKTKLYKLYDKYTKNCGILLDESKSVEELREESKLVILSYIENISEMI